MDRPDWAGTDSPISMTICDTKGKCCDTGIIDSSGPDFDRNQVKTYRGNEIGGCNAFQMSTVKEVRVKLHGTDGWLGEEIDVYLFRNGESTATFQCCRGNNCQSSKSKTDGFGVIDDYQTKTIPCKKARVNFGIVYNWVGLGRK